VIHGEIDQLHIRSNRGAVIFALSYGLSVSIIVNIQVTCITNFLGQRGEHLTISGDKQDIEACLCELKSELATYAIRRPSNNFKASIRAGKRSTY